MFIKLTKPTKTGLASNWAPFHEGNWHQLKLPLWKRRLRIHQGIKSYPEVDLKNVGSTTIKASNSCQKCAWSTWDPLLSRFLILTRGALGAPELHFHQDIKSLPEVCWENACSTSIKSWVNNTCLINEKTKYSFIFKIRNLSMPIITSVYTVMRKMCILLYKLKETEKQMNRVNFLFFF